MDVRGRWCRAIAVWAVVAAACLGTAPAALAEEDSRARAGELFGKGVEHFDAGRYEKALRNFEQAYRLAPHHAVRVNMAGCFAKLGRPVEALFNYERFLEESGGKVDPAQKKEIKSAIARLEKQVGTLELQVSPKKAQVRLNGKPPRNLPDGRFAIAEGEYDVEVFLRGYEPHRGKLVVNGGETTTLKVDLAKATSRAVAAAPAGAASTQAAVNEDNEFPPDVERPGSNDGEPWWAKRRTRLLFGVSAGAMGLGAAITGGMALAAKKDFDTEVTLSNQLQAPAEVASARARGEDASQRAKALSTASDVMLGTGIALAAGAVTMWLFARKRDSNDIALTPTVSFRSAGLTLSGGF